MSRILGVDYGERRIGLALSDPLGIIAKPLKVIDRKKTIDYLSAIIETAKERDVNKKDNIDQLNETIQDMVI